MNSAKNDTIDFQSLANWFDTETHYSRAMCAAIDGWVFSFFLSSFLWRNVSFMRSSNFTRNTINKIVRPIWHGNIHSAWRLGWCACASIRHTPHRLRAIALQATTEMKHHFLSWSCVFLSSIQYSCVRFSFHFVACAPPPPSPPRLQLKKTK